MSPMSIEPDDEALLRTLLRRAPAAEQPDPARAARVRSAVHAAWAEQHRQRPVWPWWIGSAAAAVVAGVLVWTGTRTGIDSASVPAPTVASVAFVSGSWSMGTPDGPVTTPPVAGDAVRAGTTIATGPDGRGSIALADGVEIRLDRDTRLTLESSRRVALTAGAVYIDTTPRRSEPIPIDVTALGLVVRDIGTRYEVRVEDRALRVRVRDGQVLVMDRDTRRDVPAETEARLGPGGWESLPIRAFGPTWDWTLQAAPPREVDGRSLAEFLAWVAHEGARTVRFTDPAVERAAAGTLVYGAIDGLTVAEALDVVLPSCGLTHTINGQVITIVAADPSGRVR